MKNPFKRTTTYENFNDYKNHIESVALLQWQNATRKASLKNVARGGITEEQRRENARLRENISRLRQLEVLTY